MTSKPSALQAMIAAAKAAAMPGTANPAPTALTQEAVSAAITANTTIANTITRGQELTGQVAGSAFLSKAGTVCVPVAINLTGGQRATGTVYVQGTKIKE